MKDRSLESEFYPKILDANTYKRILVVAPHPDDETQGCAGYASLASRVGAHVHVIVLTNGDPSGTDYKLQAVRLEESTVAAKIIGMTIEFLGLQDRNLRFNSGIDVLLQQSIKSFQPDLIICTAITEPHPDHQVACLALMSAATAVGLDGDSGFYESGSALIHPTHLIPIDESAGQKRQALQCFKSQEEIQPYLSRIEARDHFRALQLGPKYKSAEAFEIFPFGPKVCGDMYVHLAPLWVHHQNRACTGEDIPKISVIIRTTGHPFLENAIASALMQTLPPFEVWVVHAIRGLTSEHLVYHHSVKHLPTNFDLNRGAAANLGLSLSSGDFAIFLDDDDYFLPTHLETLHQQLKKSTSAIAALSQTLVVDGEGNEIRRMEYSFLPNRILLENLYPIHSILFRMSVVRNKNLTFSVELNTLEDWDFWIQMAQVGHFVETEKCTCVYIYTNRSGAGTVGSSQADAHRFVVSKWLHKVGEQRFVHAAIEAINRLSHLERVYSASSSEIHTLSVHTEELKQSLNEVNSRLLQTHNDHEAYTRLLIAQISSLSTEIAEGKSQLSIQNAASAQQISVLDEQLRGMSRSFEEKQLDVHRVSDQLQAVMSSNSMRITQPLRAARRFTSLIRQKSFYNLKRFVNGLRYIFRGDFSGFYIRLINIEGRSSVATLGVQEGDCISIITTDHAIFVAELINSNLKSLGFKSIISNGYNPDSDIGGLHIVLCAQMFPKLPPGERRIIFQLEQLVNDTWHTKDYFNILENSLAVFEYSRANLSVLSEKGINYPHVFYSPLGALLSGNLETDQADQKRLPSNGFLFYGSWKPSQRRSDALKTLEAQGVSVKKVDNIFGSQIQDEIRCSNAVINIHHNASNIMEAPRVWECISLGTPVISEPSLDSKDFSDAAPAICFSQEQTPASLLSCVQQWSPPTHSDMQRVQAHSHARQLFFTQRALVGTGLVNAEDVEFSYPFSTPLDENTPVILSLPETFERRGAFQTRWPSSIPHMIFDGLRHRKGWIGCALSYRTLARWAIQQRLSKLIIVEDDVLLPPDFSVKFPRLLSALNQTTSKWDVYCGLIAVIDEPVHCLRRQHVDSVGHDLLLIDRFKSMVFNVFNRTALEHMANWSLVNGDEHTNTIDVYLDKMPGGVRTVVSHPFFVGHATDLKSTLWGISNASYDPLIAKTEDLIGNLPTTESNMAI